MLPYVAVFDDESVEAYIMGTTVVRVCCIFCRHMFFFLSPNPPRGGRLSLFLVAAYYISSHKGRYKKRPPLLRYCRLTASALLRFLSSFLSSVSSNIHNTESTVCINTITERRETDLFVTIRRTNLKRKGNKGPPINHER